MKINTLDGERGRQRFAVVLSSDDEVNASLCSFAEKQAVVGFLSGVGAVKHATVAFWNPATKKYQNIEIGEQAEVLSLTGNIATTRGKPKLHAHVVLGLSDGRAVGGHLVKATVHPTLEILFLEAKEIPGRAKDSETGLDLLSN